MQSDTVIGIVGAVVLVAVMVGVFAYEYNNAPEVDEGPDPDSPEGKMAMFNETYPTLAAMEDLDQDGIQNYNDTDMDGDGVPNSEDNETSVADTFSGSVPQRTINNNPERTHDLFIGTGAVGGLVTVTWETTSGPAGGPVDNLVVSISGIPCTNGDGEATCDLTGAEPGMHTITIRHSQQIAQAKAYQGSFSVDY